MNKDHLSHVKLILQRLVKNSDMLLAFISREMKPIMKFFWYDFHVNSSIKIEVCCILKKITWILFFLAFFFFADCTFDGQERYKEFKYFK